MKLIDPKDNLIANEWRKRHSLLDAETREKFDTFFKNNKPNDYQLKVIKRVRRKPVEGDIFVLSPREGVYFYGRVLKASISHVSINSFTHGKHLVFIFRCQSKEINIDAFNPNYEEILIRPAIVDDSYWSRGYFFTIGNEPINDEERGLDIGFYNVMTGKFFTESGVEMDHRPKFLGIEGIATIIGIAMEVNEELIIDPELINR